MEQESKKTREIDILAIVKSILTERKLLLKFVLAGAILGVIVALETPKSYTTEVVLAPELSTGGLGLSGSLADMASNFGVDLGSKSSIDAIYPEIYPEVLGSTDFILTMFDVPVRLKDDTTSRTYYEHLIKDPKTPFWDKPKGWIIDLLKKLKKKSGEGGARDPFMLSPDDEALVKAVRGAIGCVIDKKTSVISLSVTDQDAVASAILADTLQRRLRQYITDYRTQKARKDQDYYQQLYEESKRDYQKAQLEYTRYADSHNEMVLQSYRTKLEELENEMQLRHQIYAQQAAQLQTARAKVQERTPVFTVIQAATVPNRASSTPRSLIVMIWVVLAVMADVVWVYWGREWWKNRKKKDRDKDSE